MPKTSLLGQSSDTQVFPDHPRRLFEVAFDSVLAVATYCLKANSKRNLESKQLC